MVGLWKIPSMDNLEVPWLRFHCFTSIQLEFFQFFAVAPLQDALLHRRQRLSQLLRRQGLERRQRHRLEGKVPCAFQIFGPKNVGKIDVFICFYRNICFYTIWICKKSASRSGKYGKWMCFKAILSVETMQFHVGRTYFGRILLGPDTWWTL